MAAKYTKKDASDRQQPFVTVSRADVDQLVTEIMQVKEFLPKVLNADLFSIFSRLDRCEQELEMSEEENKRLRKKLEQLNQEHNTELTEVKKRNDSLLEDCERYRQEKYELKCRLSEMNQQMGEQSEYCSSMGAAVCTLLWRVSRQQDSVASLLGGNKSEEFLHITARTVESYFETYSEEVSKETSDEFQFVLALTGTITNMAAAAQGRDFLMSKDSGRGLIDSFVTVLTSSTLGKNVKLRYLILMALYNISINFSGLQYIIKKQELLGHLLHVIRVENDSELRLNAARLLQSIVMEPNSLSSEAIESISLPVIQNLVRATKGELRETLTEVLSDLQSYCT